MNLKAIRDFSVVIFPYGSVELLCVSALAVASCVQEIISVLPALLIDFPVKSCCFNSFDCHAIISFKDSIANSSFIVNESNGENIFVILL